MIRKLVNIPRAIIDLFSPWRSGMTTGQKSSLTYMLFVLKWNKWLHAERMVDKVHLFGHELHCINSASTQHMLKEIFADEVYRIAGIDNTSIRVLDAGANIGLAAIYFSVMYKGAVIDSFEPAQFAYDLLKRNTAHYPGIREHKAAIGDKDGYVNAINGFDTASINQRFEQANTRDERSVRMYSLSEWLLQHEYDVVKLDIEGDEKNVLMDCMGKGLIGKVKCWLIEFHDAHVEEVWTTEFTSMGYSTEKRKDVCCFYKF